MKAVLLTAGMAMSLASGAAAQPAAPQAEKKICRSQKMTGSLTRVRRICHTQSEWDEIAATARKDIADISRQSGVGNGALDTPGGRAGAAMSTN